jgi:1-acyl-sn-glycerol-3-phosphate acyltransferase
MNAQLKQLLASYGRSVLGAAVALYLAGVPIEDLLYSLVAALLPVAIRYINPNDPAFGRLPKASEVQTALLTPGEPVLTKEWVEKNRATIEKLQAEYKKQQTAATAKKPAAKKSSGGGGSKPAAKQ